jgi:preprotein translocase subunit SecG
VIYFLYFIHVVVCLFLILVVLLQQGKGADLSVFGGGSTMAAFGARGAATLLHKLTVISFIIFTVTTLSIAILQGRSGSSVMSGVAAPVAAAPTGEAPSVPVTATPAAPVAPEPEGGPTAAPDAVAPASAQPAPAVPPPGNG